MVIQATLLLTHTISHEPLTVWITANWEILKEMGIPNYLICLLRNLYAGQEETELDMEKQIGSKLEKESSRLYIVTLLI